MISVYCSFDNSCRNSIFLKMFTFNCFDMCTSGRIEKRKMANAPSVFVNESFCITTLVFSFKASDHNPPNNLLNYGNNTSLRLAAFVLSLIFPQKNCRVARRLSIQFFIFNALSQRIRTSLLKTFIVFPFSSFLKNSTN